MKKFLYIYLLLFFPIFLAAGPSENNSGLKVAIFGTGKLPGNPEPYNLDELTNLLKKIKNENPDLVFFNGDLIQGLEQNTSPEALKQFEANLAAFQKLVRQHLGENIPLYPLIGNHTFVNSEAIAIFERQFQIKNKAPLAPYQLAYSITKNNAQFVLLATGLYETQFHHSGLSTRFMPILDWLEKSIRSSSEQIDFHFVIGHEPAYSSTSSEGIYSGLDKSISSRDAFWNILKNNHVLAYFCSHELIYDRSNYKGVWQLISGGLGDPERIISEKYMLRHFILLSIPPDKESSPTIKAIDVQGKPWDQFQMIPNGEPVHHFRISFRLPDLKPDGDLS